MPTLSSVLASNISAAQAAALAIAILLIGLVAYRLALKPLAVVLFRAQPDRTLPMIRRLTPPYVLTTVLLAAQAFRGLLLPEVRWWLGTLLVPAAVVLVVEGARYVLVDAILTRRTGRAIPKILRDIVFGLVYLTAFLAYLGAVFKVDLAPFLTTSAILSVVLGMALQDTLGNLFAGLAINLERPFQLDDWIVVDGQEGRVVEITWRATKIVTRRFEMVIIPNNAVAKAKIHNYQLPTAPYQEAIEFEAPYQVPPHRVRSVALAAARELPEVVAEPPSQLQLLRFAESGIVYRALLTLGDAAVAMRARSAFQERLWYHFQREGISFPYPVRTVEMAEQGTREAERLRGHLRALRRLDILSCMPPTALEDLARVAQAMHFGRGERIFSQGEPGGSMYFIKRGAVMLSLDERGGRDTRPFATLEEGQFFGEMSLLTGEARTASAHAADDCELLLLEQRHLAPHLEEHPDLLHRISLTIAERRHAIELAKHHLATEREALDDAPVRAVEDTSSEIMGKIRAFFRLS